MLGLCWTPASLQSMQKMAGTMPSNPDQLLGAILVRKDLFNRFESTMHDTCLDANNLLEYLFSLYNSTAAPAERENIPSPQSLGFIRRDSNHNRKSVGRGHNVFSPHGNMVNTPHLQQPPGPARISEPPRGIQPGLLETPRKKMKMEHQNFHGNMSYSGQLQECNQINAVRPFVGYPAPAHKLVPQGVNMELAPGLEDRNTQSASPLPPFSQIRRQGSRPYSPGAASFTDNLATPPHDDGRHNVAMETKMEVKAEAPMQRSVDGQPGSGRKPHPSKHIKKLKASQEGVERPTRRKKTHQCFCGSFFTRADNLKRHIRKCHEEKLERLSTNPVEFDVSSAPLTDFQNVFPPSSQEGISGSQQQQQQQQPQQQPSQQQQTSDLHEQRVLDHHTLRQEDSIKNVAGLKWSCFCGQIFESHEQLLEHSKTHDSST